MHIKIYFNDRPLFLADSLSEEIEPYVHHDDAIFIDEFSLPGIKSMIHEMNLEKVHAGIFLHSDLQALKKAFWKKFQLVQAAGGVVLNKEGKILMIFRRNKWDLPKGKLDPGETLETCAVREVEEETGLSGVTLKNKLLTTYHTYDESGHHILKETHWYILNADNDEGLQPQASEQITKVEWAGPEELKEHTKNTYALIIDVLKEGKYL